VIQVNNSACSHTIKHLFNINDLDKVKT